MTLKKDLSELKTFMIFLLENFRNTGGYLNDQIGENLGMKMYEFIQSLNKNHYDITGSRGFLSILNGLDEEKELKQDITRFVLAPAMGAFMYGKYKNWI